MARIIRNCNMKACSAAILVALGVTLSTPLSVMAFSPLVLSTSTRASSSTLSPATLHMSSQGEADDPELQWQLFLKHHARGSWKGIWTTYDYIGDVLDEAVASVDLDVVNDQQAVTQVHKIVAGAKRSDCATCFDSMDTRDIPVGTYTPDTLLVPKKIRVAANSMVYGPALTRSGVMATELVLSQGDARVRVVFQHAPVWEKGIEPGSCPPQGLKLARTLVSRECLRATAPTAETEAADNPAANGNPVFYRPVPPFDWHKVWGGTSWTWGEQTGNRGWSIDALQENVDDWHGSAPTELWNLRLPGGIFLQTPRVITDAGVGLLRLAWLPAEDKLLRVEAGVSVLQPMVLDDEDETMVGFEPPTLASLRCDVLSKKGDLEGQPKFIADKEVPGVSIAPPTTPPPPPAAKKAETSSDSSTSSSDKSTASESADSVATAIAKAAAAADGDESGDEDSGVQAIRNALKL